MANVQKMTIKQACEAFGVTPMCMHQWRKGTPTKTPLPILPQESRSVFIGVSQARAWAKANGVQFVKDPAEVLQAKDHNSLSPKAQKAKKH